ncbi:MAG: LCP family protein [bacterium]
MKKFRKTLLIVILIAILLLTGFYLYYFYPRFIPGMAVENLTEKNIVSEEDDIPDSEDQKTNESDIALNESKREAEDKKNSDKTFMDEDISQEKPTGDRDISEEKTEAVETNDEKIETDESVTQKTTTDSTEETLEFQDETGDKNRGDINKEKTAEEETDIKREKTRQEQKEVESTGKKDIVHDSKKIDIFDVSKEVIKKDSLEENLEEEKIVKKETVTEPGEKISDKKAGLIEKINKSIKGFYDSSKSNVNRIITPDLDENINILIMGIDDVKSVTRGKIEVDALILVKLYPAQEKVDFYNILTEEKPLFGENFTVEKASKLTSGIREDLNVNVENFVSISYEGFTKLVNNMNGVRIRVEEDFRVPSLELDLQKGKRTLTGEEALNYSRYLGNRDDYRTRITRQQQIITAIIKKVIAKNEITDLPEIIRSIIDAFKMVDTNMNYSLITKILTYICKAEELEVNYKIISY